jgi:hypothetical protein
MPFIPCSRLRLYVYAIATGSQFPDRPDKKAAVKKQRQQIEDFIRFIAYHQQLRNSQVFVDFLMPDEQEFGASLTDGSEVVSQQGEVHHCA